MQAEAEAVRELQAEGGHLAVEAEVLAPAAASAATSSVPTPGLIAAIAASIHSRAWVYASRWRGVALPTPNVR